MEDEKIVDLLYIHDENGLKEMSNKYELLLKKLSFNILTNNEDVEECISDTYIKVWNTIPPYKPSYLKSFLCKITRQLSIDKYRFNHREIRNENKNISINDLDYEIYSKSNIDNEINEMNLTNDINTFLNDIDLESRVLFVRKYFLFESSKMIASRFNMSENLINIKLFRIRKKLKSYLLKRGYKLEKI